MRLDTHDKHHTRRTRKARGGHDDLGKSADAGDLPAGRPPRRTSWSVRSYLVACVVTAFVVLIVLEIVLAANSLHTATSRNKSRAAFEASLASSQVQTSLRQGETGLLGVVGTFDVAAVVANPSGCALNFAGLGVFPNGHIDIVLPDGRVVCSSLAS
ncbi:MAG: hypothetical protein ACRDV3_14565, partial [Acidothermaceae bacterium]